MLQIIDLSIDLFVMTLSDDFEPKLPAKILRIPALMPLVLSVSLLAKLGVGTLFLGGWNELTLVSEALRESEKSVEAIEAGVEC